MGLFSIFKSFMDVTNQKQIDNTEESSGQVATTPAPSAPVESYSYHIADLAKKYETSNKGPGYISEGSKWGDLGGDSYGSYQIETEQGTMKEYLKTKDMFTQTLNKYSVNSIEFREAWKELATNYPSRFQQSQFDFLCNKPNGYNAAISFARSNGWQATNPALQAAIFSTSNESGGWRAGIFNKAGIRSSDDILTQINKLYDARASYFKSLDIPSKIKFTIMQQRCGKNPNMTNYAGTNERKDCLNMLNTINK